MRRRHAVGDDESAVDLTPMLDTVFIMLIFFIVTVPLTHERGLDLLNCSGLGPCGGDRVLTLYVTASNEIQVPDPEHGGLRTISQATVRAVLERARVDLPRAGVVIVTHPSADIGVAVYVLDQARLAGAPAVTIDAREY